MLNAFVDFEFGVGFEVFPGNGIQLLPGMPGEVGAFG